MLETQIEIEYNYPENFALARLKGPLDFETIVSSFSTIVSSFDYRPKMGRIWDVTKADLSNLSPEVIQKATQYPTSFSRSIKDVKVAIVAGRTINFQIAQLFQAYSEYNNFNVQAFEFLKEAVDWISSKNLPALFPR